jgi:hypothetical protein
MQISNIPQQRQNWYSLQQICYRETFFRWYSVRVEFKSRLWTRSLQISSDTHETLTKTSTQYLKLGNYSFLSRPSQTAILRQKDRLTYKVITYTTCKSICRSWKYMREWR